MSLQTTNEAVQDKPKHSRIIAIDILRGIALIAMASYHFTWDLENFGYTTPGLTAFGWWKIYARCIASTFLFLVGVSLFLAHGRQIRWPGFWKRFAMVAASAIAISAVTYVATPDGFIFFGILHEIALASLLGLAFLRLPPLLTAIVAAAVIAAPYYLRSEFFDHPALWWVGLSATNPRSNDYVPVLPWFGAVLAGICVARFASASGLLARLGAWMPGRWANPLIFIGRHSLAFYLIHQPLLFGSVWILSQIMPAPPQDKEAGFLSACQVSCEQQQQDTKFCSSYCGCMLGALKSEGSLDKLYSNDQTDIWKSHLADLASTCTSATESQTEGGQE
ncbi:MULTISPECIES: DUF1624 domain-containing protein [unclassified Mesorhizobium]|uniref:heparan-alpha-glucosaminide N-acetyltransferase n=1 Tax=unclassified Mesorhizobium TaxID=325217 RepID=UPI000BAEBB09|nr:MULTISPECIES: DUF1624 domain-containing protein [unclassified Mesorhizobium]TGT59345.1 DUF1624 domain-containing protein [Mesorhizobium sp. M00.F.Ca.ET.170.01.1.1]AZO12352.1 DUF1624 domain-containing protein [Mesorhizobium sp. M3A.F.Ca.ET.080.04.2.1]PBB85852.1 hypothetical protein CK216_14575 [Mesorhizobium sp. WSM3876]RWB69480.1 MAG: DUF1624 domain-containing protein [Mesorhizobium sp.]RWB85743.1 MAG: DUF1624 domain-containing protein [Mesorhizobium sp.]